MLFRQKSERNAGVNAANLRETHKFTSKIFKITSKHSKITSKRPQFTSKSPEFTSNVQNHG
ncbi:hypothetical protein ACQKFG_05480 [Peribacillus sp. NPDC076916]|uniref:hypothetical protein n=1 Tax=Peribacillus sp. NPDC076916 TaxID=3390608 RepID=UPI003D030ECD